MASSFFRIVSASGNWCMPMSATVRAAPSRTRGGVLVAEQVRERVDGAHREGRDPAEGRLEGRVARRLVLGLERSIVGQPAP